MVRGQNLMFPMVPSRTGNCLHNCKMESVNAKNIVMLFLFPGVCCVGVPPFQEVLG